MPRIQENRVLRHCSCIRGKEMGRLGRKRCREYTQNAHKADFVDSRPGKALARWRTALSGSSHPAFWAFFAGTGAGEIRQSVKNGRKCRAAVRGTESLLPVDGQDCINVEEKRRTAAGRAAVRGMKNNVSSFTVNTKSSLSM